MKTYYDQMIETMPAGLERAVLRVLSFHTGCENRIGRQELVLALRALGFSQQDRHIREAIKRLRRKGFLVCSLVEDGGGYYLAKDRSEYEAFKRSELRAKRDDIDETLKAMDAGAEERFGNAYQERLF
ncbi:MAG TPA: hypothetical protein PKD23_06815 [Bellilinea sp.]|nr:hypothetical protein [Bellilinea sp.]